MNELVRAVLDDPSDDDARLRFADWCDRHGHAARAELVRVQMAKAAPGGWLCRQHGRPDRCRACPDCLLLDREADVIKSLSCGRYVAASVEWHKGFVRCVRCALDGWEEHGKDFVENHPVEQVLIVDKNPALRPGPPDPAYGFAGVGGGANDALPPKVFGRMVGSALEIEQSIEAGVISWFRTREDAKEALSIGCLAVARLAAGLPPRPSKFTRKESVNRSGWPATFPVPFLDRNLLFSP